MMIAISNQTSSEKNGSELAVAVVVNVLFIARICISVDAIETIFKRA